VKSVAGKKVEQLLSKVNLRRTGARMSVLSVLVDAGKPQSARQIASRLGPDCPDKVTIYRVLETLVGAGLVHRAFLQKRSCYYERSDRCTESQCHPHFTCVKCGGTYCLTEVTIPMAESPYKGFTIRHQQVRLEGLCPACGGGF